MPRRPQLATGGLVFHVMNRGARRLTLFDSADDYLTFTKVLHEAQGRVSLRLLSYALMPNHWHLVLWPEEDEQLPRFMMWLTGTHSRRWHRARPSSGGGTIYQGRYRAIPVHTDHHFLVVCRYVEQNPVKAGLAARSSDWPWSSAPLGAEAWRPALSPWPVRRPAAWRELVDVPPLRGEFDTLRAAIRAGRPFGPGTWPSDTAARLSWTAGMRPGGRPKRRPSEERVRVAPRWVSRSEPEVPG
jgi:putative transposase